MTGIGLKGLSLALCAVFLLAGCKDTGKGLRPAQKRSQVQEYDCRKQDDQICEVPWKDKMVLYCYKGKVPKVVRYNWEC